MNHRLITGSVSQPSGTHLVQFDLSIENFEIPVNVQVAHGLKWMLKTSSINFCAQKHNLLPLNGVCDQRADALFNLFTKNVVVVSNFFVGNLNFHRSAICTKLNMRYNLLTNNTGIPKYNEERSTKGINRFLNRD